MKKVILLAILISYVLTLSPSLNKLKIIILEALSKRNPVFLSHVRISKNNVYIFENPLEKIEDLRRNFELSKGALNAIEETEFLDTHNFYGFNLQPKNNQYYLNFETVYKREEHSYLAFGEINIEISPKIFHLMRFKNKNINKALEDTAFYLYYKEILRKLEK